MAILCNLHDGTGHLQDGIGDVLRLRLDRGDGHVLLVLRGMVFLLALRRPPKPSHGRTSQWHSLYSQTWCRCDGVLHWRVGARGIARYLQLGFPLLRRIDVTALRKKCRRQSAELHGLWYLVIGAVANVDVLHHRRVR